MSLNMGVSTEVQRAAPWSLTGRGYIFLCKFTPSFVAEHGFVPPALAAHFRGGFGAVMLVDYLTSDVGPYRELLFVPGTFQVKQGSFYSITKIYVSTMASVVNGRANWAIPKEQADFDIQAGEHGTEKITITAGGIPFARFTLQSGGFKLPVPSLIPARWRTLVQPDGEHMRFTAPSGSGQVQLATLRDSWVDPAYFPDFTRGGLIRALRVPTFHLQFPPASDERA